MAITVPADGAVISASVFGKPVADSVNQLMAERRETGFSVYWTGSATSSVNIPFATPQYTNGGWVMGGSIAVPVGGDGVYLWNVNNILTSTSGIPSPTYTQVATPVGLISQGFVPNAASMTMTGISVFTAGQTIAVQSVHGNIQTINVRLSMFRLSTL